VGTPKDKHVTLAQALGNANTDGDNKKQLCATPSQQAEFDNVLSRLPFREFGANQLGTLKDEVRTKLTRQRKAKDLGASRFFLLTWVVRRQNKWKTLFKIPEKKTRDALQTQTRSFFASLFPVL
jgi:type II secretory pathway component PulL